MSKRHAPQNLSHAPLSTAPAATPSKLVRRAPRPMVLEQRFMFDGAAVGEAVDTLSAPVPASTATHDVLHLVDAPAAAAVRTAELNAELLLSEFLQQPQAQDTLFALFHGGQTEASPEWQARVNALLQDVRSGEFSVRVAFLSGETLQGAKGAFAAQGPQGGFVIYLNQDWVQAGADAGAITRVLSEELGHALDAYLNGANDTAGDEGEAFALMLANGTLRLQPVGALDDGGTIEVLGQSVSVEFAQFTFVNAYQMVYDVDNDFGSNGIIEGNAGETAAEKEQSSHNFNPNSLGQVTVSDDTNSHLFSGNDVAAIGLNIGGNTYYGWISRPIKDQGVVRGFYFWTDKDFVDLATAQADGNQDGDSNAKDNRGFLLVVDQAWFDGFINTANNRVTTAANVDQALYTAYGYTYPTATPIHTYIKGLGSSSDRVDAALNAEVAKVATPPATDAVNDLANGTPSSTSGGGAAQEEGTNTNADPDAVVTPSIAATGNVLSNDSPTTGLTVTRVTSSSTGLAGSVPSTGTVSVAGRYGTLTLNAAGTYSYVADDSNPTVNALATGSTLTDVFSYTVSNGQGGTDSATLSVQINGSNDAPVAANNYNTAKESTTSTGSGFTSTGYTAVGTVAGKTGVLANDTDVDSGDSKTVIGTELNGTFTAGSVSNVSPSSTLEFSTSESSFNTNTISGKNFFYSDGTTYRQVFSSTGVAITAGTSTKLASGNWTVPLSAVPSYYLNASNQQVQVTDWVNHAVVFASSSATNIATGTGSDKTANSISNTAVGAKISINGTATGSLAVGMTLTSSSTGAFTAGTKISALTYTNGVLTEISLDKQVAFTTGSALTFTSASIAGQTLIGAHGVLQLNGDGSYTYTPTTDNTYLASGQSAVDVFDYTMQDASGLTSSAKLYITVYGSGATDPVLTNESSTATESGVVSNSPYVPGYTNTSELGSTAGGNVLSNDKESAANTVIGTGYVAYVSVVGSSDPATLVDTANNGRTTSQSATVSGLYGDLLISDTGGYTYTVRQGQTDVQALLPGQTLTDTFNYQVKNTLSTPGSAWAKLVITVNGMNDAPTAVADVTTAVSGQVPATGNVLANDTDVDANDSQTVIAATAGNTLNASTTNTAINTTGVVPGLYGSLTLHDDGTYSYAIDTSLSSVKALAAGETRDDVFTYQIKDTWGAFSTATLTVTVTGSNDAPENTTPAAITATAGTPFVFTGSQAISVSDPDGNLSSVILHVDHGTLSTTATGGSFVFDSTTGNATLTGTQTQINALLAGLRYTATAGFTGTDYLTIFSKDSQLAYDSDGFAINVPTNTAASVSEAGLSGGSNAGADSEVFSGTLTLGLNQTVEAQTGSAGLGTWSVDTDGTFSYTLTHAAPHVGGTASDQFTYVAHDSYGNAVTNTVTISIADDSPTASADTVLVSQSSSVAGNVLLDGTDDVLGADGPTPTSPTGGVVGVRAAGSDTSTEVVTGIDTPINGLYGVLRLKADGTYTYTSGTVSGLSTDTFVYTIEDADGSRATTTLIVTVTTSDLPPTVALSVDKSDLKIGETATITFTFSEDPGSSFTSGDIAVTGGTLGSLSTKVDNGDGTYSYTATFTPSSASGSVSVASNKFTDPAGNANADGADTNNSVDIAYDGVAPTVAITTDKANLKIGETATITFTFNEDPGSSFTSGDITVTGGTLGSLSSKVDNGDGTYSYTATFTPSSASGSVSVASNKFTDPAGNANADGADTNNSVAIAYDGVAPTVAITTDKASLKIGETATIAFTFSEDPGASFTSGDITVTGGTLGSLSAKVDNGDGTFSYTATFTPSSASGSVSVASNEFTDPAGNDNADGADTNNSVDIAYDGVAPTVAITTDKANLKIGETATITFTFNEDPGASFTSGDITVTGGTLGSLSSKVDNGDGTYSYTATFTPSSASGSVSVASNTFTDPAGNDNADGADTNNSVAIAYDGVAPTVAITTDKASLKIGETATIAFTFSEDPGASFTSGDITVTGGTLGSLSAKVDNGDGTFSYTATFTPSSASGSVSVASNEFTDPAGNDNADGADTNNSVAIAYDGVAPTVAITTDKTNLKIGETATITFTFNEDPGASFTSGDIAVTGGTLGSLSSKVDNGDGTYSYTATFTPSSASGSVSVASNTFTDPAGNDNADGADTNNSVAIAYDGVAPTVAITTDKASLKIGETATITFTFSEDPGSSFTSGDITVTGGTLGSLSSKVDNGDGTYSYTATFTPSSASGSVSVASNTFTDPAGNDNADGADTNNNVDIAYDGDGPTVAIITDKASLKIGETATITFTFSEDPGSSFTSGDITVTGGTLGSLSSKVDNGDGTYSYTATFTPSSASGSVSVASNKFTDPAGNDNADGADANNSVAIAYDGIVPTVALSVDKSNLKIGETSTITFTFSEDPGTSFTSGDITVTGGTLGSLSSKVDNGDGTFSYTATFTPSGTGTARIHVDDSKFSDLADNANQDGADTDNALDLPVTDDRPLTVSSPIVSESSPYVVFTVGGAPGQNVTLDLQSGSSTIGSDTTGPLQYFDGALWQNYVPGTAIPLPADGSPLLVRIALVNDANFEGAETLHLLASNENGTPYSGQATISDDGTAGNRFDASNTTGTPTTGTPDDDRPQTTPPPTAPTPPAEQPPLLVEPPPVEPLRQAPSATPLSSDPLVLERPATAPIGDVLTSPSGFRVVVNQAPTDSLIVFRGITDQFVESSAASRIAMPYDAFAHSRPDATVVLSALQADGRKLPEWVQFDPRSGTFQVSAPAGFKGILQIKVIARDTEGREVSTMFRMHVGQERNTPPMSRNGLSDQLRLAAQRWQGGADRGQGPQSRLTQDLTPARGARSGA